jgi:hypothetical protein
MTPTKYFFIVVGLIIIGVLIFSQLNKPKMSDTPIVKSMFPTIKAKTLAGNDISFPEDTKGKKTLIVIAFEQIAQPQADSWTIEVLNTFKNKEINYYEVPMLEIGYTFIRGAIDGGMKRGVDSRLHDNVATYYGPLGGYKSTLQTEDSSILHVFLLDEKGVVIYTTNGAITDQKFAQVASLL